MTTPLYNLEHETYPGMFALRWDEKLDAPCVYTYEQARMAMAYHKQKFGYELRALKARVDRPRYRLAHDLRNILVAGGGR